MGVWLGPMKKKVRDLVIFAPGDESLFSKVQYKFTPSGYDSQWGYGKVPNFSDAVAAIENDNTLDKSGLVVRGPFDLTEYKTVKFSYSEAATNSVKARFYVSASGTSIDYENDIHEDAVTGNSGGEASLDISSLAGNYYVGIALFAGGATVNTTSVTMTSITATAD